MNKLDYSHTKLTISNGWFTQVNQIKSPNFNSRNNIKPRLIVIHNISLPPAQFGNNYVEDFFQNKLVTAEHQYFEIIKGLKVSAHLFIKRTGEIIQFVSFDDRAWHAGNSCYLGMPACNDYSIGIELEGTDDLPFTKEQYDSLNKAVHSIQIDYPQTINHLAGHSDIAPVRKTDPGKHFDWQKLRQNLPKTSL